MNMHMDMNHTMDMHMDMMMYFHTKVGGDTILFKGWKPANNLGIFFWGVPKLNKF